MTLWSLVNISAAYDTPGTVQLAWNANPETDIAGYRVHYGTTSGNLTASVTVDTSPAATLTLLAPGTRYFCAVRAFNTSQLEGPLSSEISFIVPETLVPEISVAQVSGGVLADGQDEISLGQVNLGSAGATGSFVITNLGTADLTGIAISVSGAASGDFILGPLAVSTLAPGASTTFSVAFKPSASGLRSATLHVTNYDADENPFDIALAGSGIAEPEISIQRPNGIDLTDGASTVHFTNSLLGTTSPSETFTLTNTGTADLTGIEVFADGPGSGEFILGQPGSRTLAPGASTTLSVAFRPTVSGSRSATLHVASNDADEASFDINLVGSGMAEPEIAVQTSGGVHVAAIDLGGVNLGSTSATQTFTISNPGNAPLTDLALVIDGGQVADFIVSAPADTSLEPGESTTFTVSFRPGAKGARTALLHLYSNDPDENPLDIPLAGVGVGIPDISVTRADGTALTIGPASENIGNVTIGETSPAAIFTIANVGTADLSGLAITLDGLDDTDFTVVPMTGATLPSGASTTIQVNFSPTAEGPHSATLRIASNDPDENPFAIQLTGIGVAVPEIQIPAIAITGPDDSQLNDATDAQDFGGIYIATTSAPRTLTIRNSGTADLTGLAITTDGPAAADFIVSSPGVTSLAPGASTTFQVSFQPSTDGTRAAALHIASNAPDTDFFDIPLAGSGIAMPMLVLENADGTPVEPGAAATPFGSSIIGTAGNTLTYVVRNAGTADLTGIRITTTGLRASSFLLDLPSGSSLAPGGSMSFNVTFKPTGVGSHPAAIVVTSDSTLQDALEIALDGTGIAVPSIRIYQDDGTSLTSGSGSVSFGNCNLGSTTPTRTFTIKNSGTGTLSGLSVASDGSDFNLGSLGSTSLAPGASTTFKVNFQPSAAGTRGARLVVASNDADTKSFTIVLTGRGIEVPEIVVELASGKSLTDEDAFINFGTVDVGSTTKSVLFTIRNTGTGKLDGLGLIKNGINSTEFGASALRTRSLAPGTSTTFKVNFSPAKSGIRWGAIHITCNDADESSFDIVLTGTGRKSGSAAPPPAAAGLTGNSTLVTSPPVKGTEVIGGRKYLTLTIAKTPGTTVVPRDVEVSSNLVDWASGKRHTTVLLDNTTTLKVRDNTPVSKGAKRYIRLKP